MVGTSKLWRYRGRRPGPNQASPSSSRIPEHQGNGGDNSVNRSSGEWIDLRMYAPSIPSTNAPGRPPRELWSNGSEDGESSPLDESILSPIQRSQSDPFRCWQLAVEAQTNRPQSDKGEEQVGIPVVDSGSIATSSSVDETNSSQTGSTLIDDSAEEICYLCGRPFHDDNTQGALECRVYLPCGHCFGHGCLLQSIIRNSPLARETQCPHQGCIALQHRCGHITAPTITPPERPFRTLDAGLIPWNCEFCDETRLGQSLQGRIGRLTNKLREMNEGVRACLLSIGSDHFRPMSGMFTGGQDYRAQIRGVRDRLNREHNRWWSRRWGILWALQNPFRNFEM